MDKSDLTRFTDLASLPLSDFDRARYSIYVIDKNWNYLFVNEFVRINLGERAQGIIGKNMWDTFPELRSDGQFSLLRTNTEHGRDSNLVTISPITGQRLNITGHPLMDCYIFTSSILPKKQEVLDELRRQLSMRQPAGK
jgi:hypothetical protein